MTLRKYLQQRHIELDNGRSCLALEQEYWPLTQISPLPLEEDSHETTFLIAIFTFRMT